jgi:hypothetical protein
MGGFKMTVETMKYCVRAVIQHLNGDFEQFENYIDIAMHLYEKEQCIATIGELVPTSTKEKIYEVVS